MSIDVSKIKKGDRVKISLFGLPESDWLEVADVFAWAGHGKVAILMPDGEQPQFPLEWITAHEPAAPVLPDWWGSRVILRDQYADYEVYNAETDRYRDRHGDEYRPDDYLPNIASVVVDRDGNQPAEDAAYAWQNKALDALAAARADLAAFRAEVAKVRDDMRANCGDTITEIRAFEHEHYWNLGDQDQHVLMDALPELLDAADTRRLSALLDGTDQ